MLASAIRVVRGEILFKRIVADLNPISPRVKAAFITIVVAFSIAASLGNVAERLDRAVAALADPRERPIRVQARRPETRDRERMFRQIRRVEGVGRVIAVSSGNLLPDEYRETGWSEVHLYAYDSDNHTVGFFPPSPGLSLREGQIPPIEDEAHVLLGGELASAMSLSVGDKMSVREREFTVGGIWAPSTLMSGNYVQVSLRAGRQLMPGVTKGYDELLVYARPGADPNRVARHIWEEIPGLQVTPPEVRYLTLTQDRRIGASVLLYTATVALLASVLILASALVADTRQDDARRGSSARQGLVIWEGLILGVVAGLLAIPVGGILTALLNNCTRNMYASTVSTFSLRCAIGVLVLGCLAGLIAGLIAFTQQRRMERGEGPSWTYSVMRYATGYVFVALVVIGLVVPGAVIEFTFTTLEKTRELATGRIGLEFPTLDKETLHRLLLVPGLRGITVETYGGVTNEDEEGWNDGLPSSGVFYGVRTSNGHPGVTILHAAPLWVGREIRRDSPNEVVLGYDLAQQFGLHPGGPFTIHDRTFIVTGIRERLMRGIPGDFNVRADISWEAFQRILGYPLGGGTVTIFVPPIEHEEDRRMFVADLASRLGPVRIMDVTAQEDRMASRFPGAVTIERETSKEPARRVRLLYSFSFLLWGSWLLWVAGHTSYALSTFDTLNRREEIGLRRLFGATDGALVGELMARGMALAAFGALIGIMGGWRLAGTIGAWIDETGRSLPRLLLTTRLAVVPTAIMMLLGAAMAVGPGVGALREEPAALLEKAEPQHGGTDASVAFRERGMELP